MPFWFRKSLSAGIAVAPAVLDKIRLGDRARNAQNWEAAADAYGAALQSNAQLPHIWVQLGHAKKELGKAADAEVAYRKAIDLAPDDADALFQLGRLLSECGIAAEATSLLMAALAKADIRDTRKALWNAIFALTDKERGAIAANIDEMLARFDDSAPAFAHELRTAISQQAEGGSAKPLAGIVYDASDLIAYFNNARLPTGIQRVQLAIVSAALATSVTTRVCCFIERRDHWLEVPRNQFLSLAALSVSGGDRDDPLWQNALDLLHLTMGLSPDFAFRKRDCLVNLGTSWWLQNYFINVRAAKRDHSIYYVPFVHDLIPIKAPEHCIKELTQDFISWILGVFSHADHFIVNSQATRRDLIDVAKILGNDIGDKNISAITLDAAFTPAKIRSLVATEAEPEAPFVLFVSTIESRKGHAFAFEAWAKLIARHGDKIPTLICVGGRGWLNEHIYARLDTDATLRAKISIRSHLSDSALQDLYDKCLFTLYPSLYEGWGLPVTESLCHGKVPLLTTASSLPEAGGPFAVYVAPGSVKDLEAAADRLIFDEDYRLGLEARIRQHFHPRSWADLAKQVDAATSSLRARCSKPAPAAAQARVRFGAWYSMGRNQALEIWPGMGTAERFRIGTGWLAAEDWGCRVKGLQGGRLELGLPVGETSADGPLHLYIHLRGAADHAARAIVSSGDGHIAVIDLPANQYGWLTLDLPFPPRRTFGITVRGEHPAYSAEARQKVDRSLAIGIHGFAICRTEDHRQRRDLIEAIALDNFAAIDAFGKPEPR